MPRVVPKDPSIATVYEQPSTEPIDPGLAAAERAADSRYLDRLAQERHSPYGSGRHSYFRDLIAVAEARERRQGTFSEPRYAIGEPSSEPPEFGWPQEAEAQARIDAWHRRDLSAAGSADMLRPDAPIAGVFGQAARQTGKLAAAFDRLPLSPGMVDVVGGLPTVSIPRLATGAAVGAGTENASVTELDPTSSSASSAVGSVSGLVDAAYQLLDFSRPTAMDQVLAGDLGRAFGSALDAQLLSGVGSGGSTKGLLSWASILSVSGVVTGVETFVNSCWQAYSQCAGASGFGESDPSQYLTIVAPRRLAWMRGGTGATSIPTPPLLPGTVVASGGIPLNQGAGTNEDVAIVVEKSNVLLLGGEPVIRAFPETGSSTLTARLRVHGDVVLLLKNPKACCKVIALTPPSGF